LGTTRGMRLVGWVALIGALWCAPALGNAQASPSAFALFETMVETMRGLSTVSADLQVTSDPAPIGRSVITGTFVYKRPNQIKVTMHDAFGTTVASADGKKYKVLARRDDDRHMVSDVGADDDGLVESFTNAGCDGSGMLPTIFSQKISFSPDNFTSLTIDPPRMVNGVLCDIIRGVMHMQSGDEPVLFAIGHTDHILRKDLLTVNDSGETRQTADSLWHVTANVPVQDSAFAVFVPRSAISTDVIEPGYYDPSLRIGTRSFALKATDTHGRAISVQQYRGRVVFIDYWATWCGYCMQELPDIRSVYAKYHTAGFDVVTISCDDDNTADALHQFLQQSPFPWREIYDGQGMDSPLVTRYNVGALPFGILIGRNGTILRVAPRGKMLASDVAAAIVRR